MATDVLQPMAPHPALGGPGIYIDEGHALRLSSWNSVASVAVVLTGRQLRADGRRVQPFSESHTPNTDRTVATAEYPLAEGWLANLSAIVTGAAPLRGQTYIRVDLIHGRGASAVVLATLLQGYVTAANRRAWPGSPLELATEGPGAIRAIAGTNPAAGAEISETVPTGARWRLHAAKLTLVCDGTVANRYPVIIIDDGATDVLRVSVTTAQTAGQTVIWNFLTGAATAGPTSAGTNTFGPWPVPLLAGWRIRTTTGGIVAGDDYAAPELLVEEWLEGA